jgi:hypothetical protein
LLQAGVSAVTRGSIRIEAEGLERERVIFNAAVLLFGGIENDRGHDRQRGVASAVASRSSWAGQGEPFGCHP